ncbi:bifunctional diguanylate cyclase/phosphodiesterase [Azoarcus sp. KH32C]|uniref:putative bifunctional diguanylate cyclase/phosphodiesterase n=1 Tax=Azoarcus sp. KH32C TaxID=748247 RepID=UPI0002386EBB|nr:EAL domain-containing protein [Azoarcus sp. KH32C]BAL24435.1 putative diguanylate cyclase/phosphodiesterase [Azoarcus sp. KH32C]
MRTWFDNLPIQKKLSILNVLTALIAGIVAALLLVVMIWRVEYDGAKLETEVKAAIIAENALPALQFGDRRTAREVLFGLSRDRNVVAARIVSGKGEVFAEYESDAARAPHPRFGPRDIEVEVPMLVGTERVATLRMTSDTAHVLAQIATYVGAVGFATIVSLLVGSLIVLRLQRGITDPLSQLTSLMKDVSLGGDLSRRASVPSHDELGDLSDSFNRMIEQVELRNLALGKELSERIQAEKRLEHLAHHDQVTGLPNRHFFRLRTADLQRAGVLQQSTTALFFIDLDNFKYINDTFGHDLGDQVLIAVAERLSGSVRAHDMVVRFGGDEFVVLLDRVGDESHASRIASKLLQAVTEPMAVGGQDFFVTCSIGVALAPVHSETFEALLQKADAAMYAAKSSGKNAVRVWEPAISYQTTSRFALESDLRQALARGEIELHYQPIVELATQHVAGVEALMRWRHPTRGFVPPTEFIPIAEDSGLIMELGEWAMRTGFSQVAAWNQRFGPLFVAVNVSGRQFRDPAFPRVAERIAHASGLAREMSELEVTESIIMEHSSEAVGMLEDLSTRGFSLAIDDFGTGYSSLSYLKRFPLDKLKIDRSFVKDLPDDREDAAIAEAIVGLARTLSMRVVAEGIETAEQARMLTELGCQYGQGYYFSKPLPVEQLELLLSENRCLALADTSIGATPGEPYGIPPTEQMQAGG